MREKVLESLVCYILQFNLFRENVLGSLVLYIMQFNFFWENIYVTVLQIFKS